MAVIKQINRRHQSKIKNKGPDSEESKNLNNLEKITTVLMTVQIINH